MTEPQVWTIIGVLAATLVGFVSLTITLLLRTMNAQFNGLRREITAEVSGLRREMSARFDSVDQHFAAVDKRMDMLDRDVQALTRRVFGIDT